MSDNVAEPADVERIGGRIVLTDPAEIDAAFTVRNVLDPLDAASRERVLLWVAGALEDTAH